MVVTKIKTFMVKRQQMDISIWLLL